MKYRPENAYMSRFSPREATPRPVAAADASARVGIAAMTSGLAHPERALSAESSPSFGIGYVPQGSLPAAAPIANHWHFNTIHRYIMAKKIHLRDSTAEQLHEQKGDGDTYNDVVDRLLKQGDPESDPLEQLVATSADQLAHSAMNVSDLRRATREQLSASEYFRQEYGVDPAHFNSVDELRAARGEE